MLRQISQDFVNLDKGLLQAIPTPGFNTNALLPVRSPFRQVCNFLLVSPYSHCCMDLQEQQISFEAMCYFVDSVVHNVSQTYLPGGKRPPGMVVTCDPHTVSSIVDTQEGMFKMLLPLHYRDATMLTHLAKLMEAFSRLLAIRKDLAAPAIEKVHSQAVLGLPEPVSVPERHW